MSPHRFVVTTLSCLLVIWGLYVAATAFMEIKARDVTRQTHEQMKSVWSQRETRYLIAFAHVKKVRMSIEGRVCDERLPLPPRHMLLWAPSDYRSLFADWTHQQEAACARPILQKLEERGQKPVTRQILREIVEQTD